MRKQTHFQWNKNLESLPSTVGTFKECATVRKIIIKGNSEMQNK